MLNIKSCPCRVCPQDGSTDRSCRSVNTIKRKRPNEIEAPILLSGRPGLVVRAHDTQRVRTCAQQVLSLLCFTQYKNVLSLVAEQVRIALALISTRPTECAAVNSL